jgi:hypothetical protein
MMRDGSPLGPVAAALASPETAERIALMEAATSGGLSALDAALLSLRRAGHDTAVLDGLQGARAVPAVAPAAPPAATALVQEAEELLRPLGLGHRGSS